MNSPRSTVRAGELAVAIIVALGAASAGQAPQSRPTSAKEMPTPMPRDRYSACRPLTVERFRSVFSGYDLDGNGTLTAKEALAAGISVSDFKRYDLDHNQLVTADEFDWVYGADVRARGLAIDAQLQSYLLALDTKAHERQWTSPKSESAPAPVADSGAPRTPSQPAPRLPAPRTRYSSPESKPSAAPRPAPTPPLPPRPQVSQPPGKGAGATASRPKYK